MTQKETTRNPNGNDRNLRIWERARRQVALVWGKMGGRFLRPRKALWRPWQRQMRGSSAQEGMRPQ